MTKTVAESTSANTANNKDRREEFMVDETDSAELDGEEEIVAPRVPQKDPSIRRKIEDRLERKRLREELGIYDDEVWGDL